jgi:Domain of unknown function (DUF5753)
VDRRQVLYQLGKNVQIIMRAAALRTRIAPTATLTGQFDRLTAIIGLSPPAHCSASASATSNRAPITRLSGFRGYDDLVIVEHVNGDQQLSDTDHVIRKKSYLQMLRDPPVHDLKALCCDQVSERMGTILLAVALGAAGCWRGTSGPVFCSVVLFRVRCAP